MRFKKMDKTPGIKVPKTGIIETLIAAVTIVFMPLIVPFQIISERRENRKLQ